jgi:AcrR family transcriptional regulator
MPKVVDHEQYRKELLHKCFDVFAEKGYASITTREIAKELGVSTGTLYYYFPRKEDMFEQLVEETSQQYFLMFAGELKGKHTLLERFEALGDFIVKHEDRFIKEIYILVDFCQQQGAEAVRKNATLARIREASKQSLTNLFEFSNPALAEFVLTQIQGLLLKRLLGDPISIHEQIALMGKMIVTSGRNNQKHDE